MGKAGTEADADGHVVAGGAGREPDAGGHRDGPGADGKTEPADQAGAPQKGQPGAVAGGSAHGDAGDASARLSRRAVYRLIHQRARQLKATVNLLRASVEDAVSAGYDREAIIEAIRLDGTDLDRRWAVLHEAAQLLEAVGAKTQVELLVCSDDPVGRQSERNGAVYDLGRSTFWSGDPINANPYAHDTPEFSKWNEGYIAAMSEDRSDGGD